MEEDESKNYDGDSQVVMKYLFGQIPLSNIVSEAAINIVAKTMSSSIALSPEIIHEGIEKSLPNSENKEPEIEVNSSAQRSINDH